MLENAHIIDLKSITIEYPNTSHKLYKTISQVKKVSQEGAGKISNSPLFMEKTKKKKHLDDKMKK